jgi:hypothetical protein
MHVPVGIDVEQLDEAIAALRVHAEHTGDQRPHANVDLEREVAAQELHAVDQGCVVKRGRAEDAHRILAHHVLSRQNPQQGGLAGAVCADEHAADSCLHLQIDAAQDQRLVGSIAEAEISHLDGRAGHRKTLPQKRRRAHRAHTLALPRDRTAAGRRPAHTPIQ